MYSIIKIDFISSDKNFNRYNTPLYMRNQGIFDYFLKIFFKNESGYPFAFICQKNMTYFLKKKKGHFNIPSYIIDNL